MRIIDNSYEGRIYQGFNAPLVLHDKTGPISLNDGFIVPEIGETTQLRDVLLEVTLVDTTRIATVPLKYRCNAEDIAAIAETEGYFRQICAEMSDLVRLQRAVERGGAGVAEKNPVSSRPPRSRSLAHDAVDTRSLHLRLTYIDRRNGS